MTSCNVIRWNPRINTPFNKNQHMKLKLRCRIIFITAMKHDIFKVCKVIYAAEGFHGDYLKWKWLNGVYGFFFQFFPKLKFIIEHSKVSLFLVFCSQKGIRCLFQLGHFWFKTQVRCGLHTVYCSFQPHFINYISTHTILYTGSLAGALTKWNAVELLCRFTSDMTLHCLFFGGL